MQTLAYLMLALALLVMSIDEWGTAAIMLAMALLVWACDWPNRMSDP